MDSQPFQKQQIQPVAGPSEMEATLQELQDKFSTVLRFDTVDWKNRNFFNANQGVHFGDLALRYDFDPQNDTWYMYIRRDLSQRKTKMTGEKAAYLRFTSAEVREIADYIDRLLAEWGESGKIAVLESTSVAVSDYKLDEFWSDDNLVITLKTGQYKMRPQNTNGTVALVIWGQIPDTVKNEYHGWNGPYFRLYPPGMTASTMAGNAFLKGNKKPLQKSKSV